MKFFHALSLLIATCSNSIAQEWPEPNNRFFLTVESFELSTASLTGLTFGNKLNNPAESLHTKITELVENKKATLKNASGEFLYLGHRTRRNISQLMIYSTEWDPAEGHPPIFLRNGSKFSDGYTSPSFPTSFEEIPLGAISEFQLSAPDPDSSNFSLEAELESPSYTLEFNIERNRFIKNSYFAPANSAFSIYMPQFSTLHVKTELRVNLGKKHLVSISISRDKDGNLLPNKRIVHFVQLHQLPTVKEKLKSKQTNLSVEVEWIKIPTSTFHHLSEKGITNSHRLRSDIQKLVINKSASVIDSAVSSVSPSEKATPSRGLSALQYIYPTEYEYDKFDYNNRPSIENTWQLSKARGYWSYSFSSVGSAFEERPVGTTNEIEANLRNGIIEIDLDTEKVSITKIDTILPLQSTEGPADIVFPRFSRNALRKLFSIKEGEYQLLSYSHPVLADGTIAPTQTIAIFARAIATSPH